MLIRSRRRRHHMAPSAEINLINLVDLSFVLLIIFIITAPMLQSGIEIQLPSVSAAPVTADDGVVVSVDRTGKLFLGDVRMASIEELEKTLPSYLRSKSKRLVYLRGDESVMYGRVLQVFTRLKDMNLAEVYLMVDPETRR